jgi:hypothetical protein
MSNAKPPSHHGSPLETLLMVLKEGRDAAMRLRKASVQREFLVAKHVLSDAYADFQPEDLPVDMQRVLRDFTIARDRMVDEACEDVEKAYRITVGVLKIVAERHPAFYEESSKESGYDAKSWRGKPLPRVAAPRIARTLPAMVLLRLSSASMQGMVDAIRKNKEGVSFHHLCDRLGLNQKPSTRLAAKSFLRFLRKSGHVTMVGTGRGLRYVAGPTLRSLRQSLITQSEAAKD